jgi:hypothetical protein
MPLFSMSLPAIEVRGFHTEGSSFGGTKVWSGKGHLVHEDMLRHRSKRLATKVIWAKAQGGEKVILEMSGSAKMVSCWIDWVYGQPMFARSEVENTAGDDMLCSIVDMFNFALEFEDYDCANACLDSIRELLCHSDKLENPIRVLEPILRYASSANDKPSKMIVDVLAYGPCAESGRTLTWMDALEGHHSFMMANWVGSI